MRRDRRRAPAIEIAAAYAQTTKAVRRRYEPREAIYLVPDAPEDFVPDVLVAAGPAPAGGSLAGSYFDGHFAITPSFSTWNVPSGASLPFSTTSESVLKVSGTMPL